MRQTREKKHLELLVNGLATLWPVDQQKAFRSGFKAGREAYALIPYPKRTRTKAK